MTNTLSAVNKQQAVTQVLALIAEGLSANAACAKVAEPLDVVGRTVMKWCHDAGHQLGDLSYDSAKKARLVQKEQYAAERQRLAVLLWEEVVHTLSRMREATHDYRGKDAVFVAWDQPPANTLKDFTVAVGVLIDKMRLEEGKSTGRQEHVSVGEAYKVLKDAVESEEPSKEEAGVEV